ncbi:hypothetical protein PFICI_14349 [Pestalotiopsis fici W106-1]|uniref:Uncharacterized protein n=1 Tax=Pestalotiopsis fici (strain W106-1 / CGMCC3.15140) TaxID=1229662 RepID=W3WKR7_PESFW|nr:uncharacterized protein PFICI_14349 [Pestalotiopsis fici W106-1]ETS74483.1 hypothetical protein PFICI_14349 [Pestalotiopsis fici W106-1]
MTGTKSAAVLFLAASQQLGFALAQDLSSTIVGCEDVACPKTSGSDDTCTVSDETFLGVGLTRIPDVPDSFAGLTIVKGVNVSTAGPAADSNGNDRQYKSVYYLGAPDSQTIDNLDGCAIVFHDTLNGIKFNGVNSASDQGTCQDVISQSCIDALTQQVSTLWANETSGDRCAAVSDALASASLTECVDMVGTGKGLGNFTAQTLSDLSPISGDQNASSNCWPITPKSDSLAKLGEETDSDGYDFASFQDQVYKLTPVLTLLSTSTNDSSSQLSCVKLITTKELSPDGESAASSRTYSILGVGIAIAASMLVL